LKTDIFNLAGNWYRGNLHLHTTFSDGTLTPEEICSVYRQAGYHFVALADHWSLTEVRLDYPDFITIPAVEYNSGVYHIVALGVKTLLPSPPPDVQEIIDAINQQQGVAVLAHPYWSGITSADLLNLKNFQHLEIYNNVCQITKGKGYSTVHWDELLQNGRRLSGVAVDDAHHRPTATMEDDLAGSYVMVKATALEPELILEAIRNGHYYSSTGVSIHEISLKDNILTVQTSPVREIRFLGYNAQGLRVSGCGKEIERAEYKISGHERYLRVEAVDAQHRFAWTNPFYLEDFFRPSG